MSTVYCDDCEAPPGVALGQLRAIRLNFRPDTAILNPLVPVNRRRVPRGRDGCQVYWEYLFNSQPVLCPRPFAVTRKC
jgi:hypothetical protein